MLDLLQLFAGEFEDVHSFMKMDFGTMMLKTTVALMRTYDGKIAFLHSSASMGTSV